MQQHFNIGKKQEVNPFEKVTFVKIVAINNATELLYKMLNKKSVTVETRKINDEFVILYNVELLDFTSLLTWLAPYRGKFQMSGKSNHNYIPTYSIHFNIEDDIMSCW